MPQISILIPVYNRADLIGDTLKSIQQQSYQDWECILVDDGSTDKSWQVINEFAQADHRFKPLQRPAELQKGANTCRNIALSNASGAYAIFFDSDDLMTPDHLEVKLAAIEQQEVDMLIAQTAHFNHPDPSQTFKSTTAQYQFKPEQLSLIKYYDQMVNWLTYDPIYKTDFIKELRFHPDLKRGQEYYFHIHCLLKNPRVGKVDKVLTLRRMHEQSIRSSFDQDQMMAYDAYQKLLIYNSLPDREQAFKTHVLKDVVRRSVRSSTDLKTQSQVARILWNHKPIASCYYLFSVILNTFGLQAYRLTSAAIKNL